MMKFDIFEHVEMSLELVLLLLLCLNVHNSNL